MLKIALVSNTDFSLYNFRMGIIEVLLKKGYSVHIVCPYGRYVEKLKKKGVHYSPIDVDRKGTNPIKDLKLLWQLYRIFKREKFDVVHSFTIKPNIYGNIAAKLAEVPVIINSVTGLGYVFTEKGLRNNVLGWIVVGLYKIAFKFSSKVIFLNIDDLELFKRYKIINKDKAVLIKSEGVNTEKFSPQNINKTGIENLYNELKISQHRPSAIVTLITRLIWHKGIREFVEAARILKGKYPDTLFLLVGPIDKGNPAAVSKDYIEKAEKGGVVKYIGSRDDIRETLYISDVVTLPSYREGIPKVLLEAMSMEKPIITTDTTGCREVVEEGKNGFLVPAKNSKALAEAIERLIENKELRKRFGKYGREKVLREFDERIVVKKTIKVYEEAKGKRRKT